MTLILGTRDLIIGPRSKREIQFPSPLDTFTVTISGDAKAVVLDQSDFHLVSSPAGNFAIQTPDEGASAVRSAVERLRAIADALDGVPHL